ncbi:MAG: SurA N-terminal domain-containing protein [Stappiaceae bacterium]
MNCSRSCFTVFAVAFSVMLSASLPAEAQNKIAVIVNDEAVTSYDISQRARLLKLTSKRRGGAATKAATNELVDERLKLQEATRIGISVSQSKVDDAYATIAKRSKLTSSKLTRALKQSGINPQTLKDRLKADLAWSEAVRMRFRSTVSISEQDVIAALQGGSNGEEEDDPNKTTEYTLTQFVFVVPKKASGGFKAKRKREVEAFRKRFTSCGDGTKLAKGLNEVVVKPLGRKLEPDLGSAIAGAIKDVSVGRTSKAIQSASGFEIYAVCDKKVIDSNAAAVAEMRGELRNKEGQLMARRYLSDLKRTAVIDYR